MKCTKQRRFAGCTKTLFKRVGYAAIGALAMASVCAQAAWEPNKPMTFVVTGGSGGGADQIARLIQTITAKHKLAKQPFIVVIENGGGGGQGFMDIKNSTGDPNKIMIALANLHSVPLATKLPFNWRDTTPIALMALDQFVLWVNAKSPYTTAASYLKAVKAEPGKFKMGGAGAKREDEIVTKMIEHATGAKFTFIPYRGGGEITAQLVGGHIDSDVNNPIEHLATWKAGEVRPLCVFDAQPMPDKEVITDGKSWNSIPTCDSEGIKANYQMIRGIFMPKGVTADQTAFYVDLMKKVRETPEWADFMKHGAYKDNFLTGDAFSQFLVKDEQNVKDVMEATGMISK